MFNVLLSVNNQLEIATKNLLEVEVKSDQTLASFKRELINKYALLLADYTLILIGRELKDDERTLEVLGFIPGCTIHAGKYYLFIVVVASDDICCSGESAILRLNSNCGGF